MSPSFKPSHSIAPKEKLSPKKLKSQNDYGRLFNKKVSYSKTAFLFLELAGTVSTIYI